MITNRDYQAAKRWVEDNLLGKPWYSEYKAESKGRGRRGIKVYIGYRTNAKTVEWGKANE
jgi:hypothetical protein